ncbi:MAG: ABC transporter ATP-binding protein [Chloroflexota bacterium]|nr:ABC transporter ATP-binding protein [Chloroflexota bacterium]
MAALAIETERLSKHFTTPGNRWRLGIRSRSTDKEDGRDTITAVDQVSLQVRAGELFGLLGPNGAGKTTLIKLLCTVVVPSSGTAAIFGADLTQAQKIREMIGMASGDERSFYWRLSGRRNLAFFASLYGLNRDDSQKRSNTLLQQVGLLDQADRPFRTYSSGQKQRLSIARALLPNPRLLFLDEPTRSLDPTATFALHQFIENELLQKEGMTILLTTHRLDEAERLCDRIGIMDHGQLKASGAPDELRAAFGPTVTYRLKVGHLGSGPRDLTDNIDGQLTATPLDGDGAWTIELQAIDNEQALAALIDQISKAGGQVFDISRDRASLEQVFQRFTESQ